jgi:hypothetical protein
MERIKIKTKIKTKIKVETILAMERKSRKLLKAEAI